MTNCSCLVLFIVVDQRKFWRVLQPIICVWKQSEIGILIFFFRSIEKITFFGSHCEKNGIENNNPFLCSFVNVIWDHFCVTNAQRCNYSHSKILTFKLFFSQFLCFFSLKCWFKGQIISRIHLSLPNAYKLMCFDRNTYQWK